jgi:putative MATE family efflux protein
VPETAVASERQQRPTPTPPERSAPSALGLGVWELAWPTTISYATHTLVRWADLIMVGPLGREALAGVGLGNQAFWLVQSIGLLVPTGATALLARAVGAGDYERADRVLRHALWLAAAIGALTTLIGIPLATTAIRLYGAEPEVVELGAAFLTWLLVGNVPYVLTLVINASLRAEGDSRTPLVTGVIANAVNVALNFVLIYGYLGFPAFGVRGAAMASSVAMAAQLAMQIALLRRRRRLRAGAAPREPAPMRTDRALLANLFKIGWPTAVEGLLFAVGILWFQRLVSGYGTEAVAAYSVGAAILSLAFLPGMGFAAAASALVGQHLGNRDPAAATRSGWRAAAGALVCLTTLGAIIVTFAHPAAGLFSRDQEVQDLVVLFIYILGAVLPLMAVEYAMGGSLRGAGDTFFPLAVVFTGLFICRLIPATVLALGLQAPLGWVWSALVLDYLARATLLARRFRGGRWKTVKVWEGRRPAGAGTSGGSPLFSPAE